VNDKIEGREAKSVCFTKNVSLNLAKQAPSDLMVSLLAYRHFTRNEAVATISAPAHQSHRYKACKWKTDFLILCTSLGACAAV